LNLSEDTIVVYDAQHFAENKITIQKISKILEGDSLSTFKTFKYCGGEFFFIPQSRVDEITFNIEKIWKRNESSDFSSGEYFQTEEHFLSLAIHNLHSVETTNSISRLWTTRTYRKIPKNYRELLLIHLPAEKDNGISKLFSILFEDHESTNLEIFTTGGRKRLYRILNISQSIFGALQFQFSRFLKSLLRMIRF
jgi:hypothetical protein